ncbi:MAG: Zinc ribbon domain protein [Firmicutes bacterium ADurb.Bin506]|nr:MAG: Zinc ribbon domain protein [Firmicutes bacterium ADurb.Bin506]
MPIYEYKCEKCGKFEFLHRAGEEVLIRCPKCGSPVKKLISTRMGIVFHGSGFYVTDNRPAADGASDKPSSKPDSSAS